MTAKLSVEEQHYNKNRLRWLKEGKGGKFVLIKGQKARFFSRLRDAKRVAHEILSREQREQGDYIHCPMLIHYLAKKGGK